MESRIQSLEVQCQGEFLGLDVRRFNNSWRVFEPDDADDDMVTNFARERAGSLDDILHRYWPYGAASAEVVGLSADEAAAYLSPFAAEWLDEYAYLNVNNAGFELCDGRLQREEAS